MEETTKKKRTLKLSLKAWLMIVIVLLSLGTAAYFWNDARNAKQQTPEAIKTRNEEETSKVVTDLGNTLLIEEGQDPTVARIEDPSILQSSNPDFYKDAQTGDYLILYPQRAIIYRLDESKIINIAPIINTDQLNQNQGAQDTQDTDEETPAEN